MISDSLYFRSLSDDFKIETAWTPYVYIFQIYQSDKTLAREVCTLATRKIM